MKSNPGFALINQILATSNVLLHESHRFFRPLGISEAQFNVLTVLGSHPEGISQRELSDVLVVDRSNVTALLDRMEKNGLVVRTDHPSDRRVYCVSCTPAGRKLHARVMPLYLQAIAGIVAGIPANQMKQTLATLEAVEKGVKLWAARQRE